ncbi:putative l-isoaspartyl protein carboxyl methyltransferase [Meira miltonrushii]|uniref:Protein-L-isoaspartate O-methyltransferase n=1 Tax=Meira miltonrushii TaxID=1280837 RepID=A0A316V432_9BASI|nr:putative l-isoaspartyl protein carboxyl methyltransferase [Meira miltonrushii]PWN32307.1 putative l-isoaspartyl protein carboxyl methyltransferase [Meira miltonrushii]
MAWRCSGNSNHELLSNMRSAGLIKTNTVFQAMQKVDRKCYVPVQKDAYLDSPQSIGYGATISAPHMHAYAVEALLPFLNKGGKVLDIGSGSGYTMAIFWHLVKGENAYVLGIDHLKPLVDMARSNLQKDGLEKELQEGVLEVMEADGRLGYPQRGPYSAIHVGAAASTIPEPLIEQLAKPGRMFIPVEDPNGLGQDIWHVDKDEQGKITKEKQFGVMYVPLTDAKKQWPVSV